MKNKTLKIAVMLCVACLLFSFDVPKDWFVAGSKPENYNMGIDRQDAQQGGSVATIQSKSKKWKHGFGTLMQNCTPGKFLGKRVRMSGKMKSSDVRRWAGFWFRVDKATGGCLAFDNMYKRSVKGTTDWKSYEIILDVPGNATNLAYGALLTGSGQIWFDDIRFEVVDSLVPTTGNGYLHLDEPGNLDFER